jgi:hypothetical protein
VVTVSAANALLDATEGARYVSNPYHRPPGSPMGQPIRRPYPHASKCPKSWDLSAATRALKEAIRAGCVSLEWRGGFPQVVWYRDGETSTKPCYRTGQAVNIMLIQAI